MELRPKAVAGTAALVGEELHSNYRQEQAGGLRLLFTIFAPSSTTIFALTARARSEASHSISRAASLGLHRPQVMEMRKLAGHFISCENPVVDGSSDCWPRCLQLISLPFRRPQSHSIRMATYTALFRQFTAVFFRETPKPERLGFSPSIKGMASSLWAGCMLTQIRVRSTARTPTEESARGTYSKSTQMGGKR